MKESTIVIADIRKCDVSRFSNAYMPEPNTGCWIWTKACSSAGYGNAYIVINGTGRNICAHRLSYIIHYGLVPEDKFVCHACDNKYCVNPQHLWIGDNSDNMLDAYKKSLNKQVKLSAVDVKFIKTSVKNRDELAAQFSVSASCIRDIFSGRTWKRI